MSIAVIDYGMGNLHSVTKAVERLGYDVAVTSDESAILAAAAAILPGVGAFGDAMRFLREKNLDATVRKFAATGKPLLGICLGMQLLFAQSEEHGLHEGLRLLPGKVVRLKGAGKVPHMGWNRLEFHAGSPLLHEVEEGYVYFVHSYKVVPDNPSDLLASTDYCEQVAAIVGRNHVYGMQFHPEKSGRIGMQLLHNFLKLA
ncbi:MAG TPA: imidazole glycerol phosphate synthase subunit HisH [Bacilli bacterium]